MAPHEKWSVRLLLDEDSAKAVSDTKSWGWHDKIRYLAIGGWNVDGVDDSPYVTFELEVLGPDAAEHLARELVSHASKVAGLKPGSCALVWVAPLREDEPSSHRFLEQAKELFDNEQYELAIVAAQIHFELQVRLLMERSARRSGQAWARRLTKNPRVSMLSNDVSTAAAELLLQIDVTQQTLWPAYKVHLSRRNAVVHEGAAMGKKEAQESINVVQALWAELAKVERPTTLF